MAKGLASSESSCGYIDPAMNTGMGVNMHMCATSDPNVSCFSPSDAMQEFCKFRDSDVNAGGPKY